MKGSLETEAPTSCDDTERSVQQLRIGVVFDCERLAPWQSAVLDRMLALEDVKVTILLQRESEFGKQPGPIKQFVRACWTFTDWIERAIICGYFCRKMVRGKVASAPLVTRPDTVFNVSTRSGTEVRELATKVPTGATDSVAYDLLIDLGSLSLSSTLPAQSQHGTWTIRTGRGQPSSMLPLGFWEFYYNDPICEIQLRQNKTGPLVAVAHYAGHLRSWNVNALVLGQQCACLVIDTIREFRSSTLGRLPSSQGGLERPMAPRLPDPARAITALVKACVRIVVRELRKRLFEDQWRILIAKASDENPAKAVTRPMILVPPASTYWADPFPIRYEDRKFVFFEEFLRSEGRGVISCLEVDPEAGAPGNSGLNIARVLDQPYHLSYPFLFRHEGSLYMIPESSRNRTIELWRCEEFPRVWQKRRNMMEGVSAADSSLLHWNDCWWLFTNICRTSIRDHRNELHIFHCQNPIEGTWIPHAYNPVVSDARKARMAGGFLTARDGQPIRCSQVQGHEYGMAIAFHIVEELSATTYRERTLSKLECVPAMASRRQHHVSAADGLITTDVNFRKLKMAQWLWK